MAIPDKLYSKKLSSYQESIKILYLIDDNFKMICDDYCYCKLRVEKYEQHKQDNFRIKVEYENLTKELEEDIIQYITKRIE